MVIILEGLKRETASRDWDIHRIIDLGSDPDPSQRIVEVDEGLVDTGSQHVDADCHRQVLVRLLVLFGCKNGMMTLVTMFLRRPTECVSPNNPNGASALR
jgi:hypothetical protein